VQLETTPVEMMLEKLFQLEIIQYLEAKPLHQEITVFQEAKRLHQEIIVYQEVKPLHREATVIELKAQEMKHLEIYLKEVKVIEVPSFKEVLQAIETYQKIE
jgi:hypothetical protein